MIHSFITPTKFINDEEIGGQSDFLLALSHLMDKELSNEYSREVIKFKEAGRPVYLDNGLFENNVAEDIDSLIDKAIKVKADVVFSPDVLRDPEKTREKFQEFYEESKKKGTNYKIAYILQADRSQFIPEFFWANENPAIDIIAIPIHTALLAYKNITESPSIMENRIAALYDINKVAINNGVEVKDVHLLGLGEGLQDLIAARRLKWVKSVDSSSAFQTALAGQTYNESTFMIPGGKNPIKVDFEKGSLLPKERELVKRNIRIISTITHYIP